MDSLSYGIFDALLFPHPLTDTYPSFTGVDHDGSFAEPSANRPSWSGSPTYAAPDDFIAKSVTVPIATAITLFQRKINSISLRLSFSIPGGI